MFIGLCIWTVYMDKACELAVCFMFSKRCLADLCLNYFFVLKLFYVYRRGYRINHK